jgi:hypothetical protein
MLDVWDAHMPIQMKNPMGKDNYHPQPSGAVMSYHNKVEEQQQVIDSWHKACLGFYDVVSPCLVGCIRTLARLSSCN